MTHKKGAAGTTANDTQGSDFRQSSSGFEAWRRPRPLVSSVAHAPAVSQGLIDMAPLSIRAYLGALREVDPGIVLGWTLVTLLVAFSVLVARCYVAWVGGTWIESPHLWGFIVADSAFTKSPSVRPAMRVVQELQRELQQGQERGPIILAGDATLEANMSLGVRQDGLPVLCHRHELSGLFADMNKQSRGAERAGLLDAYDGGRPSPQFRAVSESRTPMRLAVSLFGTVQEEVYRLQVERDLKQRGNDGLPPRFQFVLGGTPPLCGLPATREPDQGPCDEVLATARRIFTEVPGSFDPSRGLDGCYRVGFSNVAHALLPRQANRGGGPPRVGVSPLPGPCGRPWADRDGGPGVCHGPKSPLRKPCCNSLQRELPELGGCASARPRAAIV